MIIFNHFFKVVQVMIVQDFVSDDIASSLFGLISTLLQTSSTELSRERHQKQLTSKVFKTIESQEQLFMFCRRLLKWEHFQRDALPSLLNFCQEELLKGSSKIQDIILILTEVIFQTASADSSGLDLASLKGLLFFPKCGTRQGAKILKVFLDAVTIENKAVLDKSKLSLTWSSLVCIPCIRYVFTDIGTFTRFLNQCC